jgi:hypothetical protein
MPDEHHDGDEFEGEPDDDENHLEQLARALEARASPTATGRG